MKTLDDFGQTFSVRAFTTRVCVCVFFYIYKQQQ